MNKRKKKRILGTCWCQWLTPVILANSEVEIRRIIVRDQPRQIVCKTPPLKKQPQQNGLEVWLEW
jgi:hypothetical protein